MSNHAVRSNWGRLKLILLGTAMMCVMIPQAFSLQACVGCTHSPVKPYTSQTTPIALEAATKLSVPLTISYMDDGSGNSVFAGIVTAGCHGDRIEGEMRIVDADDNEIYTGDFGYTCLPIENRGAYSPITFTKDAFACDADGLCRLTAWVEITPETAASTDIKIVLNTSGAGACGSSLQPQDKATIDTWGPAV